MRPEIPDLAGGGKLSSDAENDDERTLTVMTSRPFLEGPLCTGARRSQRRSCSLRCACSTLTPPTRRHGRLDRAMAIRALSVATVVIRGVRLQKQPSDERPRQDAAPTARRGELLVTTLS